MRSSVNFRQLLNTSVAPGRWAPARPGLVEIDDRQILRMEDRAVTERDRGVTRTLTIDTYQELRQLRPEDARVNFRGLCWVVSNIQVHFEETGVTRLGSVVVPDTTYGAFRVELLAFVEREEDHPFAVGVNPAVLRASQGRRGWRWPWGRAGRKA